MIMHQKKALHLPDGENLGVIFDQMLALFASQSVLYVITMYTIYHAEMR